MIIQKKTSIKGDWAKKGEDIKDRDIVTLISDGEIISGEYGDRHVFKINTRNGEKNFSMNQTSLNNLVDGFGEDTANWINKEVKLFSIRQSVGGKLKNVYYVAPNGWELDENSEDLKFVPGGDVAKNDEIPVIESDDVNAEAQLASEKEE